jgi:hypothetical protein
MQRSGDHQSPGPRDAVRLAIVHHTLATRTAVVAILRGADQTAGLASDRAGQITARAVIRASVVQPLPYRLAVERGIHPDKDKGQAQQSVNTGCEANRDQVAELHIGDEHAEHKHVNHRPRAQFFSEREDPGKWRGGTSSRSRIST